MKSIALRLVPAFALALAACGAPDPDAGSDVDDDSLVDPEPEGEGVLFDQENPGADIEGKADMPKTYEVPTDLPTLERPEVIVSLDGLTVHFFDRATGFNKVYPAGVGQKNSAGRSITPTGFFKTGGGTDDTWYYTSRRYTPDYFGGFPFLRLNAKNSDGDETYALHGPISFRCPNGGQSCNLLDRQWSLRRGYVSHGCVRMATGDIVEAFWIIKQHPTTPVVIQKEKELDAAGNLVDVGTTPKLFEVGASLQYGTCGKRADPYGSADRWPSRKCDG
jgi:lipoprotein-anchoring transpeptidase ErfK/SrfK